MRESIISRLKCLEKQKNILPTAIVLFSDGHKERMDFHEISVAFFERNSIGIVSLEWERASDNAIIFQLLSCPDTWEYLTKEGIQHE